MAGSWERRKNAADSDVPRMYLRGRNGSLKVETQPLEHALARAKVGPEPRPSKSKPLSSRKEIVAVAASATQRDSAKKREKALSTVGNSRSSMDHRVDQPSLSATRKQQATANGQNRESRRGGDKRARKSRASKSKYDGQPKFEGGFRFVQGGLPELGKR